MNIVYARMLGYQWSVPSDAVARELEKLGHKLIMISSLEYLPPNNYDFVWSPYESVTLLGEAIASKLGIPHVSHVEVIPPWRAKKNVDYHNYGLPANSPELNNEEQINHYRNVGRAWKNAAVKTVSNHCRVDFHHKLLGEIEGLQIRYPSVDVAWADIAKQMYSPKRNRNRVITISRATEIKRFDLLVKVMNKVKTPVTWTIIGGGPMLGYIKEKLDNKKVKLELLGTAWGWPKYYHLLQSHVMVYAMGGMPPIEAALMGVTPIVIENQPTDDLPEFDKFMRYNFANNTDNYETSFFPIFKHNQIDEMAKRIDEELAKPLTDTSIADNTVEAFLAGNMNVTPSSVNATQIIERFKKVSG